ncbi:ATP-grasp domain-containing protein [Algoriphagus namhaensis]
MHKLKVLVFPCGSEIGLEVYRSLAFSRHIELVGASSVRDHGAMVYENYIGDLPFVDDQALIEELRQLVAERGIDLIYPTMDSVIAYLSRHREKLGCKIIGSSDQTNQIALSKRKTYEELTDLIPLPRVYNHPSEISEYPVFAKPEVGYGSNGVKKLRNEAEVLKHVSKYPDALVLTYLPGDEYTVDCFTDKAGKLLFVGPRKRNRVQKGISVNTTPAANVKQECLEIAERINRALDLRGAWFFQVKKDKDGVLTLLEIATRLGGSSALYRVKGINFALMSVFDAFDYPVAALENNFDLELDRAFDQRYRLAISYDTVYVDLDDCLIIENRVNSFLVALIFQARNEAKRVCLITKHERDLASTLKKFKLLELFDELIHLKKEDKKYRYMKASKAIFIDDSFVERKEVYEQLGLPVFAPDAVPALLQF